MPYRTLARNEHAEQDNAEIASIARQSRVRVMRVALVLAAMFIMIFASAVAAAESNRSHEKLHCYKVTVLYEDSLHTGTAPPPPATHTVCEWQVPN